MNVSLAQWHKNGWLLTRQPDAAEISGKLDVIERDLRVCAQANFDADWRFVAAFNAALQCAAAALLASGYDLPKGNASHQRMIDTLQFTIGIESKLIDELQAFRAKRGGTVYDSVGIASDSEIDEIGKLAGELKKRLMKWMKDNHKSLMPSSESKRSNRKRK